MRHNIYTSVPVIDVKGLSRTYISGGEACQALKDISFKVNQGEFVAIQGHSACGMYGGWAGNNRRGHTLYV